MEIKIEFGSLRHGTNVLEAHDSSAKRFPARILVIKIVAFNCILNNEPGSKY